MFVDIQHRYDGYRVDVSQVYINYKKSGGINKNKQFLLKDCLFYDRMALKPNRDWRDK